jgi:hypothetical protein
VRNYKEVNINMTFVLPPCSVQAVNTIVLVVINLCSDDVIAVLMSVIFLVGKQPRLEIGAAAMQNAIAKIEDLIDRTSAKGQESLGVTHQE